MAWRVAERFLRGVLRFSSLIGQECINPLWYNNWLISKVYQLIKLTCNVRSSTNKSPIKLSVVENKLTRWFVYEWGKPTQQKLHRVILRSPLLRIHYYQNKRLQVKESQYLIPIYSWTLTPIPNWTCFVVTISPFQYITLSTWLTNCADPSTWLTNCADPSTWLNHQLEKNVGCKVFQFIMQ